jgi:hypothetical protein
MTTKTLSTSTLSLRFMQNAHRAKNLAHIEADKMQVKDDAEWHVAEEVREAWGIAVSSSAKSGGHGSSATSVLLSSFSPRMISNAFLCSFCQSIRRARAFVRPFPLPVDARRDRRRHGHSQTEGSQKVRQEWPRNRRPGQASPPPTPCADSPFHRLRPLPLQAQKGSKLKTHMTWKRRPSPQAPPLRQNQK